MGNGMSTIIAAMAELERGIIRKRVVAGLHHTRQDGTRSGKAVGRPGVIFRRDHIAELRAQGLSWRQIARKLGVALTTIRRAVEPPAGA
jgi:putative DNA-invertase from lambdoid prophage Rac